MDSAKAQVATESAPPNVRDAAVKLFSNWGLIVVFAAVIALFWILNAGVFATWANAQTIALTQSTIALVALAVTVPIIAGQFDLSAGYQFGFGQAFCAVLIVRSGFNPALAVVTVLAAGALIGLVNGLLVTRLQLPSFTTTLGTGILVLGITEWITGNEVINGRMPQWFLDIGRGSVIGIPLPFIYLIAIGAVLFFALEYTVWGRRAYATGNNTPAAFLSGINTDRTIIQCFLVGGLLSAFAGCLSVMSLGASTPSVGLGTLLPAFAASFLGATSIKPGRYNIAGTLIAVYLVGTGIIGLQQLGAEGYVEQVFYGVALLTAVILAGQASRLGRR